LPADFMMDLAPYKGESDAQFEKEFLDVRQ
jgi:hypothetical protein